MHFVLTFGLVSLSLSAALKSVDVIAVSADQIRMYYHLTSSFGAFLQHNYIYTCILPCHVLN